MDVNWDEGELVTIIQSEVNIQNADQNARKQILMTYLATLPRKISQWR
jgi:hypothetical protein